MKIKIDEAGIRSVWDVLEPQLAEVGKAVANGLPASQNPGTLSRRDRKGRPVVLVAMRTPNGMLVQAKTGALTMAAARLGLDVHRYGGG